MPETHQTAKTQYVSNDEIKYAYRRFGKEQGVPLVFLIHFRGTMDHWDPLLVNSLAKSRPVILFDNAGVGKSSGSVANTIEGMAKHVIDFLALIKVEQIDLLGFSMGGYIAQSK
jgi:pimeloyl-ACP methyl ester carboxylesterase